MDVKFEDHSKKFESAAAKAKQQALWAIGATAERHAKEILTREVYTGDKPYDLTGRLRNSITFATKENEGESFSYKDNTGQSYNERRGVGADENSVYIGTNVEYALGIELGTHRKAGAVHFLQKAATGYSEEYKRLAEAAYKSAEDT